MLASFDLRRARIVGEIEQRANLGHLGAKHLAPPGFGIALQLNYIQPRERLRF
jgi:hypothetical protein